MSAMGAVLADLALLEEVQADFAAIDFASASRRRAAAVHWQGAPALLLTDSNDPVLRSWAYLRAPAHCGRILQAPEAAWRTWMQTWEGRSGALLHPHSDADDEAAGTASISVPATSHDGQQDELTLNAIGGESSPIVRFVSSVLFDALKAGASDIHLESDASGLAVKFRLDGVLAPITRLEGIAGAAQTVSRIKVMSELDIAERRIPQDGRLTVRFARRAIDVRVSIMPSVHGEDVVLRILDREHLASRLQGLTLAKLGFDADTVQRFKRLCARPYGMVLVTGPTGSGKTTSLYAALTETRNPQEKIVTIEDPVEYQLDGVLQIPVNEKKGLTFAKGLRSILRHDPDRILVGEIRDQETAQIAVQSALTGHLVYTTVHANNAFDVLSRFTQLSIDTYDLAAALNGVLAQRLIRLACVHCKQPISAPPDAAESLNVDAVRLSGATLVRAVGCPQCRHTGYRGRCAIGELLIVTTELKALLGRRADPTELQRQAYAQGLVSLREQALRQALRGDTTLAEVERVTLG